MVRSLQNLQKKVIVKIPSAHDKRCATLYRVNIKCQQVKMPCVLRDCLALKDELEVVEFNGVVRRLTRQEARKLPILRMCSKIRLKQSITMLNCQTFFGKFILTFRH